jgi:hypothetical protein
MLTRDTSLTLLTATASEKENHGTQGTKLRSADDNVMGMHYVAQNLESTSSASSMPLASIINNNPIGKPNSSVKRVKGLAVIGIGLMDKYIRSQ